MGNNTLAAFSWQQITKHYAMLGRELGEYEALARRFNITLPVTPDKGFILPVRDDQAEFVGRWYLRVNKINERLKALDREIKRRNNLLGVMG